MTTKIITVLGRDNHAEAMRVASGLTIFGHEVRIVFMTDTVAETEENAKQEELRELGILNLKQQFLPWQTNWLSWTQLPCLKYWENRTEL